VYEPAAAQSDYGTFTLLFSLEFRNDTVALKNLSAKFGTFMKYVDLCLIGVELCKRTDGKIVIYRTHVRHSARTHL